MNNNILKDLVETSGDLEKYNYRKQQNDKLLKYFESNKINAIFINSAGWILNIPIPIHDLAPPATLPIPGIKTNINKIKTK